MRIVITGGAGFVGSHLCERFLAEGQEVVCVDNFITGHQANLDHLRRNIDWATRFTFIRHDISHPLEIDGQLDKERNRERFAEIVNRIVTDLGLEQLFLILHNENFHAAPAGVILFRGHAQDEGFLHNKVLLADLS